MVGRESHRKNCLMTKGESFPNWDLTNKYIWDLTNHFVVIYWGVCVYIYIYSGRMYIRQYNIDPGKPAAEVSQT